MVSRYWSILHHHLILDMMLFEEEKGDIAGLCNLVRDDDFTGWTSNDWVGEVCWWL